MQGSNFQIDREPLLELPIIAPDADNQILVADMVRKIIDAKRALNSADTEAAKTQLERYVRLFDRKIDEFFEDLYGISHDEKETIAQATERAWAEKRATTLELESPTNALS